MNEMKRVLHCVEFHSIWPETFSDIAHSNCGISASFPQLPKPAG
jgi:hypothetical protein